MVKKNNTYKEITCFYHDDDDCSKIKILVKLRAENHYLCDKCKSLNKKDLSIGGNLERNKHISEKLKGKDSHTKGKTFEEIQGNKEKARKRKEKQREDNLIRGKESMLQQVKLLNFEIIDNEYLGAHHLHHWRCLKCKTVIYQRWNDIQQCYKCPTCFPRNPNKSLQQQEVFEFIKSLDFEYPDLEESNRYILSKNKELDIVIHSKKIAIEYNGLYYHSTKFNKNKYYHIDKYLESLSKGYKLLTIFEDEWKYKRRLIENILKENLLNNKSKMLIENFYIKEVSYNLKNSFLNRFDIKGKDKSIVNIGAFDKNNLIGIITLNNKVTSRGEINKDEFKWELSRVCIKEGIIEINIITKLLEYFKNNYNWKKILFYDDLRWSKKEIIEDLGFLLSSNLIIPTLWMAKSQKRWNRINLRKKNLEEYYTIYDCGILKYKLEY